MGRLSHTVPAVGETGRRIHLPSGKAVDLPANATRPEQASRRRPVVSHTVHPKGSSQPSAGLAGLGEVGAWDDGPGRVAGEQGCVHSVDLEAHTDHKVVAAAPESGVAAKLPAASAGTKGHRMIRQPLFVSELVEANVPGTRSGASSEKDHKGCRAEPDRSDVGKSMSCFYPRHRSFAVWESWTMAWLDKEQASVWRGSCSL